MPQDPAPLVDAPAPATAPAPVARIRQIMVQGNQRLEPGTVQSYLLLGPGDVFDPARIDLSLKTLFATGLFADVEIHEEGDTLVVSVVENPIINRVIFENNRALKEDKLRDEVEAQPRAIFTRARVQADVQRIVDLYRQAGHFAATVTPKVAEQPQNRVDLIFEISEGPVTNVRRINFVGNLVYSDSELRRIVATKESRWYKFLTSNDNYDPDRLEYDREQLRKFYGDKGYADFRVVSSVAELTPDQKDFFITFTVDEGIKYKFGELTVESELDALDTKLLKAFVRIKPGSLYKNQKIDDAVDSLTFAAGASGYAFVDVRPQRTRNRDKRTVDVKFVVNEGPRVYVERIDVVGNTQTLDRVIRREVQLVEGDAFNRVLLDRSRNLIRGLGFFKSVEITEKPGSKPDRAVVEVTVEEQPTGELSFGLGFSSVNSFLVDISVTQRNFRGRGQFLRFAVSASARQQQIDMRFTEPRFLGRNLSAGIEAFNIKSDFIREAGFRTNSLGGSLRIGFPTTANSRLFLRYTARSDKITAPEIAARDVFGNPQFDTNGNLITTCRASLQICSQLGRRMTSLVGYSLIWDKRNDPITPTRGFNVSFDQEFAGVGGDVRYVRSTLSGDAYRGIIKNFTLSAHINAGYITAWGGKDLRINDRFFKGGLSFRGFDIAGIGPRIVEVVDDGNGGTKDLARQALGGKAFAIGALELTIPTGLPEQYGVKGALFTEWGTLGLLDSIDKVVSDPTRFAVRDNLAIRGSAGVSIFWDSPFGPVRFDFSRIIRSEVYDDITKFRFSQVTRF
ncbi:MAG: outer membrane protein assembly factor BamA [Robiginitomaculum sp.]|nr:outer membrane protein assembly factor BamA [Robiginitomaculum sp.]MDQ7078478.1 outer membrane protein assembly factor BamA [Robiginitomaculum sp.]